MSKSNLISLPRNRLKALLITSAQHDIRKYLKSVCFKAINGKVWGIATDGYRIGRLLVTENYQGQDFEWVFDRKAVKNTINCKGDIYLDADRGQLLAGSIAIGVADYEKTTEGFSLPERALITINDVLATQNDENSNPRFKANFVKDLSKIAMLFSQSTNFLPLKTPTINHINRQTHKGNVFVIDGVPDYVHIIMPMGKWSEEYEPQVKQALQSATILADLSKKGAK